jgi:hypothetical protein
MAENRPPEDGDDRLRRVGENEALYRLVNEQIETLSAGVATSAREFGVICECGTLSCTSQIMIRPEVYEQTRALSDHFIVLRGHQFDDIERVVEDHETFFVIEKTPEEAKRIAQVTDPRE